MRCHNSENWPQRNGNKRTLELTMNYLKQPRPGCCWSDHWWPIWRWLSELTVLFLHVAASHPPTPSLKALVPCLLGVGWGGVGESALGQIYATLPPKWPASEMRQTFLSTSLACLLAFEWPAARARTHSFGDTGSLGCSPSISQPSPFLWRTMSCCPCFQFSASSH